MSYDKVLGSGEFFLENVFDQISEGATSSIEAKGVRIHTLSVIASGFHPLEFADIVLEGSLDNSNFFVLPLVEIFVDGLVIINGPDVVRITKNGIYLMAVRGIPLKYIRLVRTNSGPTGTLDVTYYGRN